MNMRISVVVFIGKALRWRSPKIKRLPSLLPLNGVFAKWCTVVPALYDHLPCTATLSMPRSTHFNIKCKELAKNGHFCLVPRVSVHGRYYCIHIMLKGKLYRHTHSLIIHWNSCHFRGTQNHVQRKYPQALTK